MEASPEVPADNTQGAGLTTTLTTVLEFNQPGTYRVPFSAPVEANTSLRVWIDGGTWRGVAIYVVSPDGEVRPWDRRTEYPEFARSLVELEQTGQYQIECLGEPNGTFCERYNNTSEPTLSTDVIRGEKWLGDTPGLQGLGHFLIQADFDRLLRLEFATDRPVWIGDPVLGGRHIPIAPEMFRADYTNISRCISIGWCGTMVGGQLPIDHVPGAVLLVHQRGLISRAVPHIEICLVDGAEELACSERNRAGTNPFGDSLSLRHVIESRPGLALTLDAVGPPMTDYGSVSNGFWSMGGVLMWFEPPGEHPASGGG